MTVEVASSPRRRILGEKGRFSGGLDGVFRLLRILRPLVASGFQSLKRPCFRELGGNETSPTVIAVGLVIG